MRINGRSYDAPAEPRTLLSDYIRAQGLTGTKVGCESGECGSCTVQLDGEPVRACLVFAIQVQDAEVTTIEGLDRAELKAAFNAHHAVQCGFCTAGVLMTLDAYLREHPEPAAAELEEALAGNWCRCAGHQAMVEAVLRP